MKICVGLLSALALVATTAGVALGDDIKSADELPEAVRMTLAKEAEGATIEDVEREKRSGATVYEVELERNNEEWDLTIDEKGKVIERTRDSASMAPPATKPPAPPQPAPPPTK